MDNPDGQLSFLSDWDGGRDLDLVVGNSDGQLNDCPSVLVPRLVLVYEGAWAVRADLHRPVTPTGLWSGAAQVLFLSSQVRAHRKWHP